jgi:hypothetical protein
VVPEIRQEPRGSAGAAHPLDRDVAVDALVVREPHLAHAALAE